VLEPVIQAIYKVPHVGPLLRTWPGRVIALVVASQLLLPLHYYAARRDSHDERFAWRMFSPMRMTECSLAMTVDEKPFPLATEFHVFWMRAAERGRLVVVESMAQHLCKKFPGKPVRARLRCKYLDEQEIEYGGFDLCDAPEL
jgi:hypothetical protein